MAVENRLETIQEALGHLFAAGERGEVSIDTGLTYAEQDPVRILIRKRGHRFDLTDNGEATAQAEKPAGWFEEADRLVAEEGFNINRRGAVFVSAVEGRDLAALALRLAHTARAVYLAILELEDTQAPRPPSR